MKWMRERDSLIAQTMAVVQTVAGRKEDAAPRAGLEPALRNFLEIAPPPSEVLGNTMHDAPPKTVQAARPIVPSEMQTEIRSRIASFRAHQERFNRERAEYFNATLARLRASLDEIPAGRSEK